MSKSTISMAIFNRYVSLPEGKVSWFTNFLAFPSKWRTSRTCWHRVWLEFMLLLFGAAKRDQTRPIKFTYVVDCRSIFYIVPFKYNLVVLNGIEAALSSYWHVSANPSKRNIWNDVQLLIIYWYISYISVQANCLFDATAKFQCFDIIATTPLKT
jgi:hypothetical protein